jgi:hypothetical protein
VKINYRDPSTLRGFVKIFFNKVGYEIWFVSEKYKDKSTFPPSPLDGRKDYDREDEEEEDNSEDDSDRKHRRVPSKQEGKNVLSKGRLGNSRSSRPVVMEVETRDMEEMENLENVQPMEGGGGWGWGVDGRTGNVSDK